MSEILEFLEENIDKLPLIPICTHDHNFMSASHIEKCHSNGKMPLIKEWQKRSNVTREDVELWKKKFNDFNIGLVLGESSEIVAIDVDGEYGFEKLQEISNGDLPPTWEFETPGGGYRYLYKIDKINLRYSKWVDANKEQEHSEVALLGDGAYTVMPPSIHKNGKKYIWIEGRSPKNIEIALVPKWMEECMTNKRQNKKHEIVTQNQSKNVFEQLKQDCMCFAKDLRIQTTKKLDEERWFLWITTLTATLGEGYAIDFSKLSEKFSERSIDRINSLKNEEYRPVRCQTFECSNEEICDCFAGRIRYNDEGEIINSPGNYLEKYVKEYNDLSDLGFILDKGKPVRLNQNIFAEYLLNKTSLIYTSGDTFYIYKDNLWSIITELEVNKLIRDKINYHVPNFWRQSIGNLVFETLKLEAGFVKAMNQKRAYINLENGFLNVNNFKLTKHKKKAFSSIRVPIIYDEKAECPNFIKFLNDLFESDQQRVNIVQEMYGYCMTTEINAQTSFWLVGGGSNGKSIVIHILRALIGRENCSTLTMSDLEKSFQRLNLVDKLVNLCAEMDFNAEGIKTQNFKAIVSGDAITVEEKFKTPFDYEPFCKLVFAVNNLPYSKDKSKGFSRRVMFIPFKKQYISKRDFEKKKEENNILDEKVAIKDPGLFEKLLVELPGILIWALQGLKRLRENEYEFTTSESSEEEMEEYMDILNPIKSFVKEEIEIRQGHILKHEILSARFQEWTEENNHKGYKEMAHNKLLKSIKDNLAESGIPFEIKKSNGKRGIHGIALRSETKPKVAIKRLSENDDLKELME